MSHTEDLGGKAVLKVDRSPDYGVWKAEGWPLTVKYDRSVLEQIKAVFTEERAEQPDFGETAGVLFGRREGEALHILAFRPLGCKYAAGAANELSGECKAAFTRLLEESETDEQLKDLEVLGWYRSVNEMGCSDLDFGTYLCYFPKPFQVTMFFEVRCDRIANLGFLFRDSHGSVRAAFDHPSVPLYLSQAPPSPSGIPGGRYIMAFGLAAAVIAATTVAFLFWPSEEPPGMTARREEAGSRSLAGSRPGIPSPRDVTEAYGYFSVDPETDLGESDFGGFDSLSPDLSPPGLEPDGFRGAGETPADGALPERVRQPPLERREAAPVAPPPSSRTQTRQPDEPFRAVARPSTEPASASPGEPEPEPQPERSANQDNRRPEDSSDSVAERSRSAEAAAAASARPPDPVSRITPQRKPLDSDSPPPLPSPARVEPPAEVASLRTPPDPITSPSRSASVEAPELRASLPPVIEKLTPEPAYSGPTSGTVIWTGQLTKNDVVRIQGKSASQGYVSGELPPAPIRIRAYPAELSSEGITVYTSDPRFRTPVTEPPSAENGWNKTVYRWSPKRAQSISVIEAPNSMNEWSQLIIRSDSSNVALIMVDWEITQGSDTTARNR